MYPVLYANVQTRTSIEKGHDGIGHQGPSEHLLDRLAKALLLLLLGLLLLLSLLSSTRGGGGSLSVGSSGSSVVLLSYGTTAFRLSHCLRIR
jgi:hypothetical protein